MHILVVIDIVLLILTAAYAVWSLGGKQDWRPWVVLMTFNVIWLLVVGTGLH